jgi:hypothetical protein
MRVGVTATPGCAHGERALYDDTRDTLGALMRAMRRYWILCVGAILVIGGGCSRSPESKATKASEAYVPDPGSVNFDIVPVAGVKDSSQWIATCSSQGKTARFRIEFGPEKPFQQEEQETAPVTTGVGQFVDENGSDSSVLLLELKRALGAKELPKHVQRVKILPFVFLGFGRHLSHAPTGGGMFADPPGNWTSMKIFLGSKSHEADLFLNLNPVTKKGELSIKDPEYGDRVLAQLAKVM